MPRGIYDRSKSKTRGNKKSIKEHTKRKRGKYNKDKEGSVQKILSALREGLSRESACAVSGVARRTFYLWLEEADFCTKVEDAENFRMGVVEYAKRDLVTAKHRGAIEKEMKSKNREVYGDKQEVQQTTLQVNGTLEDMSDKQLLELIQ